MNTSNWFAKVFVITAAVTASAWILAFVFSNLAGATPKGTLVEIESKLNKSEAVNEKESIDLTGIERIVVDSGRFDVGITPASSGKMEIEFHGQMHSAKGQALSVVRVGKQLNVSINGKNAGGLHFNLFTSGEISVDDFQDLKIMLPENYKNAIEVISSSGDISLGQLNVHELQTNSSSGDVALDSCQAETADVRATSGDISVERFTGAIKVSSTSGDVSIDKYSGKDLVVHANSGDISVSIPDGRGWKFKLHANSGDVNNQWSDDAGGKKNMELESHSGNISVSR